MMHAVHSTKIFGFLTFDAMVLVFFIKELLYEEVVKRQTCKLANGFK
jgi:hypothetical protein